MMSFNERKYRQAMGQALITMSMRGHLKHRIFCSSFAFTAPR